uniref:Calcium channel, voltage-dependent, alpha 2/delta subunit 4a n=1 Tax=Sinocyclocheilus anshuiensis TaxID=1608454 RepID=A0A671SJG4_9TELE
MSNAFCVLNRVQLWVDTFGKQLLAFVCCSVSAAPRKLSIHSSIPSIFCSSLSLYSNALVLLQVDYYNSMMINTLDEDGNNVELGGEFPLEENEHFNKVPVNTQQSVIQVPTNVYNKDPDILNGVFMSEALNDIFTSNFEKDPTLTWQYFGSSTGFFRLYPGIKWTPDENGVVTFDARNRYYTHISTLADVQENVMEYLHVLSRPMVINHDHDIIWTEAYMDSVLFNTQAESLLLMTSVAMPVISKKEETAVSMEITAYRVMITDCLDCRLNNKCDFVWTFFPLPFQLGVHGYAFLNTNNGYILSHPDLRPLYKDGKKLKPKPNYNSVDLSEVEWEDTGDLRTAMVKGESGTLSLDVRATVEKGKRAVFLKNEYFYTTINETPFSLGIVLIKGLHDLTASDVTIANEWTYCETDIDPHHRKLTVSGFEFCSLCSSGDERLLQHTLFDAVVTAPMEAYWTALLLNASGIDGGVETAFLGTRSGLMRMIRYVGVEKRVAKKFLSPSDKENIFTLDHFPVWYRHAAENPAGRFLYYVPIEDSTQGSLRFVIAVTSVTVPVNKKTAVAGGTVILIFFFFFYISLCFSFFLYVLCSQDVNCYVIDSNGFIIISKDRDDVRFLGEIDGSVRSQLLKMGMFKRVLLYDYQAMCKVNPHSASGARPLQSPFYNLLAMPLTNLSLFFLSVIARRVFVINQIPDSNLLLVVIQADCDSHNASVKCDRMRSQKIRRRPESCHAYHPQENAKDCGNQLVHHAVPILFISLCTHPSMTEGLLNSQESHL